MKESPLEMLNTIAQIIYDKRGGNILAIDVQGLSTITDYLLIAEGNVNRHVSAIARSIVEALEEMGGPPLLHSEGLRSGDWVVLDYGEIMVHLFMPGLRERYALEHLWPESKLIELHIDTSKPALG
jgi:ribosome-associated protein